MRTRCWRLSAWVVLSPAILAAQTAEVDEQRSAWRYRRAVVVYHPAAGKPFAALVLPPEVGARCQPDLRDVRLVEADGRELQYVVDRAVEREAVPLWPGQLVDTRGERKLRSVWVVDFGEPRSFDRVTLDVRERDFAKRIRVEASEDGRSWRGVRDDAGVFDRPWTLRVHHTTIAFPAGVTARYLRLTADDSNRSKPIQVTGAVASASRRVAGQEWRRPVSLEVQAGERGVSRYRLALPAGTPFEVLSIETDDPAFARRVRLKETRDVNGRPEERALGEADLYRLRIADESLSGEALELPLWEAPRGGALVLEVQDGDSPPLRRIRGVVSGAATRLLFPAVSGSVVVYYGNEGTRAPLYDLESLKWRLGLSPAFADAALAGEVENPRFRKALPVPLAPARGAPLEVPRWRAARAFRIAEREDLYSLALAPQDLGVLRRDLGDVRIVDEADRQVPFTLEPASTEARVDLTVAREEARSRRGGANPVSRYRVFAPAQASRKPFALPFVAVELTFEEGFFTRPARLLGPALPGPRQGERVLSFGVLERRADGPRGPLVLHLQGAPESDMSLEVDEGDNVPLTLRRARGVVRVPRLAFKAAPGAYRVLLGNPEASAPRYDIASLRQDILSYSAVVLPAEASAPNPSYRRRAGDYFKEAPPTVLLWGALVGAVVVLLLLTVRILKQPAA